MTKKKGNGKPDAAVAQKKMASVGPKTTNYVEIQENEVSVLQSIYMDDYKEIKAKPAAWNKSPDLAFKLSLRADFNAEISLILFVSLPTTYPKSVPVLRLESSTSNNPTVLPKLQHVLDTKPKQLLGNEMIFEISSELRDILEEAAQSKAENEGLPSLEAERTHHLFSLEQDMQALEEARRRVREENVSEEVRALIEDIDQTIAKQNAQKEAADKARERKRPKWVEKEDRVEESPFPRYSWHRPLSSVDKKGNLVTFSNLTVTEPFFTSSKKTLSVTIAHPNEPKTSPLTLCLKKITFAEETSRAAALNSKLTRVEELLEDLASHRHAHVVDLFGCEVDKYVVEADGERPSKTFWELSILTEYSFTGSLSDTLDAAGSLEPHYVRSYARQILDGLEFLDQLGYVHPALHLHNILLFPSRNEKPIMKISDGHGMALKQLHGQSGTKTRLTSPELPQWAAPEMNKKKPKRTKKTCVWELGRLILEMVYGKGVTERYTSPQNYLKENKKDLTDTFIALMENLFQLDANNRSRAFDLLALPVIQESESESFFLEFDPGKSGSTRRVEHRSRLPIDPSRFNHDFENDHSVLGRGTYGQVFKVKHRLDGRYYAVKEILSDSPEELGELLQETMLLSRLHHPHVVRYFNAWLENENSGTTSSLSVAGPSSISKGKGKEREQSSLSSSPGQDSDNLNSHHDMMSGGGLDDIVFGYDTDDEPETEDDDKKNAVVGSDGDEDSDEEAGDEDDDTTHHPQGKPIPGPPRRRSSQQGQTFDLTRTTLYIQMEFCEKRTLRNIIDETAPRDIDNVWRLFRQILDGLSHIHKMGVIHRDLKPENIFIDKENNPRIGDFGLATSGTFAAAIRHTAGNAPQPSDASTRDVGTFFYVAPEVNSASPLQYNSKVDMYSLGIIFFEICHPPMMGHERVLELFAIRKENHKLPKLFEDPDYTAQGNVIMKLLTHKVSERPSAVELFQSGAVPEPVEEEKLAKFVGKLAEAGGPEYQKYVSSLFSRNPSRAQIYAWNRLDAAPINPDELLISRIMRDKVTAVFQQHGAVEVQRKSIFPASGLYSNAAHVLDRSGFPLQLVYDLTLPNAMFVSHQHPPFEKVFSFGTVYRSSAHLGREPREIGQIDFDLFSYTTGDLALKEAETLKILDEVINECPPLKVSTVCFHLNHADLLNLILDFCEIAEHNRNSVMEATSRLSAGNWSRDRMCSELQNVTNVSAAALDDLMRFNFRGDLDMVRKKTEVILGHTGYKDRLVSIFARIEAVLAYVKRFHIRTKIYIHPLSSYNEKFYRGSILFQCLVEGKGKGKSILAVGGRYDSLIAEYALPTAIEKPRAVGFHLPWDDFNRLMTSGPKRNGKKFLKNEPTEPDAAWRPRRCDVLVVSFDPSILRSTCVEILQRLWNVGISAELAKDFVSMEELLIANKAEHHGWIVLVRHEANTIGERALKVRSLAKKEDIEVSVNEITGWLLAEMRAADARDIAATATSSSSSSSNLQLRTRRRASQGDALHHSSSASDTREPEVHILATQHRGKKSNRSAIIDAATARTRELTTSLLADAPIAAIETTDEIIEGIRDTRLGDGDSWRALIQSAPLQERKYLQQVLDLLKRLAEDGGKDGGRTGAFVFNFRTRACIYYDLSLRK